MTRTHLLVLRAIAALAVLGAFGVVVGSDTGTADGPPLTYRKVLPGIGKDAPGYTGPQDYQALAASYAARLQAASTDDARVVVLLEVMQTARVGVYTADGAQVVRGAERQATDFYLYLPEIELLATSLARGDSWTVAGLTSTLQGSGLSTGGLTRDKLGDALRTAAQGGLAHPDDAQYYFALLIRELGLTHEPPLDIASPATDMRNVELNTLQRWLVIADIAIGVAERDNLLAGTVTASSTLVRDSGGILKGDETRSQVANPDCFSAGTNIERQKIRSLFEVVKPFIGILSKINIPGDIVHASVLLGGVEVRELPGTESTHYGHESPGTPLQFRLQVLMRDKLSDFSVKCGWLAGLTFPPPGPISGVEVQWVDFGEANNDSLTRHGAEVCGVACTRTDDSGIATYQLQPKQEQAPYDGTEVMATGVLTALPKYFTSLGGSLVGGSLQFMDVNSVGWRWNVGYHSDHSVWEGTVTFHHIAHGLSGEGQLTAAANGRSLFLTTTDIVRTATTKVRFASDPLDDHPWVRNYSESGSVAWTFDFKSKLSSGGSCSAAGSGTYAIGPPSWRGGGGTGGEGVLEVRPGAEPGTFVYTLSGGIGSKAEVAHGYWRVLGECSYSGPKYFGAYPADWVRTAGGFLPTEPGGNTIRGTFTDADSNTYASHTSKWEWEFHRVE